MGKKKKFQISQTSHLLRALNGESERGEVVLSAMIIENMLETLLKKRLAPSLKKDDPLFGVNRPIGTFSAKIELAYRTGLIDQETKKMIDCIREIRNNLAHNVGQFQLDDDSNKDLLINLKEIVNNDPISQRSTGDPLPMNVLPLKDFPTRVIVSHAVNLLSIKLSALLLKTNQINMIDQYIPKHYHRKIDPINDHFAIDIIEESDGHEQQ